MLDVSSERSIRVGFGKDEINFLQSTPTGFDEEEVDSRRDDEEVDNGEYEVEPISDVCKTGRCDLNDNEAVSVTNSVSNSHRRREKVRKRLLEEPVRASGETVCL